MLSQIKDKQILIVEDESLLSDIIREELEFVGGKVTVVQNGLQGLESFQSHIPDLVLSDYRMPQMDGWELLKGIRTSGHNEIPFVFLSGFSDVTVDEFFDSGADAILSKPCDFHVLSTTLAYYLEERFQRWVGRPPPSFAKPAIKMIKARLGTNWQSTLRFGKNGFFIQLDFNSYIQDEWIELDIELKDEIIGIIQLRGLGCCRWMNAKGIGVEIISLNPQSSIQELKAVLPLSTSRIPNSFF